MTGSTDVAENYYSSISLETGDIVSAAGGKNIDKATSTSQTVIGVMSTAPGVLLGYDMDNRANDSSTYPVALAGRVPVKVSLENGPIAIGDRISVSSIAGVGMKYVATSTSSGQPTVGMALEPFDGWSPSTGSGQSEYSQIGKVLVFVNLGQPQIAAKGGTGDLAEMTANTTSLNRDLNINGFSILNVKSISGMNGLWKIDENGNITAQSVNTQSLTIGGGIASGVTIYDRTSGSPTCIYIEGGVIKTSSGACGATTNAGTEAIIETAPAADSTNSPQATTTPDIIPTATTTPDIIPVATTTPEIIPIATSTEPVATTTEPVIISETDSTSSPQAATTTP